MSSSRPQDCAREPSESLAIVQENLTSLNADTQVTSLPGSCDDERLIRGLLSEAIRLCKKSREQVAEEMSYLLGTQVTKRAIDSYTSESAEQNRFPMQYARAFCHATGDWRLLRCVIERAGLHLVTPEQVKVYELGRQMLLEKRAAAAVARLTKELEGVAP